ncbi:MAG TPA: GAF domain-containing SpoIIE family protein phosphatase [Gemmatirosa sp.]|nr:GAF domain-containing SpoIIE family protein phosphatase [Gemmatirosa sp.]
MSGPAASALPAPVPSGAGAADASDPRLAAALLRLTNDLAALFRDYHASTGCHAALWAWGAGGPVARAASRAEPPPVSPADFLLDEAERVAGTDEGPVRVAGVRGMPRTWLVVGPCAADGPPEADGSLAAHARFLVPTVERLLYATVEAEQAARELGERYEEINLLYTISETLGRAVSLEENARTILAEVSETVSASRAAIFLHDRPTDTLQAIAAIGAAPEALDPVPVDDASSVVARAFRTLHASIADDEAHGARAEAPVRAGAMLTAPIVYTTRAGGEPLGVVALSGRRHGKAFTAGDLKLVTAIASQIASAIQNARLVRASLQQQRLTQEMALAHDLQMRLLPRVDVVAPDARVAARVVPADSVGGDFYHLFRLGEGRTGVMIGDVSSHGYRAALIMALAMSATAIHAQASNDPAETLAAVLRSLREELSSTEMFISCLYAVVDPRRGELRYANAGHPHAFVFGASGPGERLTAGSPPLGLVDEGPEGSVRSWDPGRDLLVLFTDGVSDARDRAGARLGEEPVLAAVQAAQAGPTAEERSPELVVRRVFDVLEAHAGGAPPRDDLTFVALRS